MEGLEDQIRELDELEQVTMDHVRLHYVMLTKSFDFKNSQILLKDLTIARAKNNWVKLMKANNMNSFIEAKDYNNQLYDASSLSFASESAAGSSPINYANEGTNATHYQLQSSTALMLRPKSSASPFLLISTSYSSSSDSECTESSSVTIIHYVDGVIIKMTYQLFTNPSPAAFILSTKEVFSLSTTPFEFNDLDLSTSFKPVQSQTFTMPTKEFVLESIIDFNDHATDVIKYEIDCLSLPEPIMHQPQTSWSTWCRELSPFFLCGGLGVACPQPLELSPPMEGQDALDTAHFLMCMLLLVFVLFECFLLARRMKSHTHIRTITSTMMKKQLRSSKFMGGKEREKGSL